MTTKKTKSDKKCDKTCDACAKNSSTLPVCLFFSMLTAIIIALTLAITFASLADRYELIDASRYKDSLSTSIQDNHRDSDGMVVISGAAIIDWAYNTKASGFVYITSKDCGSYCDSYGKNLANYLKNELELLKKKSENKKATKNQTENVEIKEVIIEVLGRMGKGRAGEIQLAVQATNKEKYATLTNQRTSAILKQMIDEGTVVKTVDKKVSTFSLV